MNLEKVIDAARGLVKADLVLKGGKLFDLTTGEINETDIAIVDDIIVGVYSKYEGKSVIDVSGKYIVPGFIDTHLHIESSMVTPFEFERFVSFQALHLPLSHLNIQVLYQKYQSQLQLHFVFQFHYLLKHDHHHPIFQLYQIS